MSDVLDFFRSKEPRFNDVPDDKLTQFIGDRYPDFLKNKEFSDDYEKYNRKGDSDGSDVPMDAGTPGAVSKSLETEVPKRPDGIIQETYPVAGDPFDKSTAKPALDSGVEDKLKAGEALTTKYLTARDLLSQWAPDKIPKAQADYEAGLKALGFTGVGDTDANLSKPLVNIPEMQGDTVTAGVERAIAKTASGLTSPESIALLAAGEAFPNLAKAVFGVWAAKGAATDLGTAAGTQGAGNIAEAATSGLINGAFAGGLLLPDGKTQPVSQLVTEAAKKATDAGAPLTARAATAVSKDISEVQAGLKDLKLEDLNEPTDKNFTGQPGSEAVVKDSFTTEPEAEAKTEGDEPHEDENTEENQNETDAEADSEKVLTPDMTGMGAATPSEFERQPETSTGIKNAKVDADRERMGMPPAMQPARRSFGRVWDEAMAVIDDNPRAQDDLISELKDDPRPVKDFENAMLLHRKIDLQNEFDKEAQDINQAHEDGREDDAEAGRVRLNRWRDDLLDLFNVTKEVGTANSLGLGSRRMMAYEDFSLGKMETEWRAQNGGRKLTPDEETEIARLHDRIAKTTKLSAEADKTAQDRIRELETEKAFQQARAEAAEQPKYHPSILEHAERIVKAIEARAVLARKRLAGKLLSASPEDFVAMAEIGAAHLSRGALEFTKWSADMISDLGERVRPYLEKVWNDSKQRIEDDAKGTPEAVKRILRRTDKKDSETIKQDVTDAIKERLEDGRKDEITGLIGRLSREFVKGGIDTRGALVDAVHEVLKGIDPAITRDETMDAISGYGDFRALSKDEIEVKLRDLKGQLQQEAKLRDMQAGKAPLASGGERRVKSDEERRLEKQVNELKKKGGYTVTDPAKQLKTSLGAIKTRLKNQISDLSHQIATRTRTVKDKRPSPSDAEVESMRKERDALKAQFHEIFGDKKMSDEQRLKMATRAVEQSMAKIERKIKENDLSSTPKGERLSSPALDALRDQRDAMRENLQSLRDSDVSIQHAKAVKDLDRSIAEYERKIKENDFGDGKEKEKPTSPEIDARNKTRDALREKFQAIKDARPEEIAARIKDATDAVEKANQELERKINEGDLAVRSNKQPKFSSDELDAARAEHDQLNDILQKMRNAAKPRKSAEEISLQAWKTRTVNSTIEYKRRLADGDFEPRKRNVIRLDADAQRAKAENEAAKRDYLDALAQDRLNNRTGFEKGLGTFNKWRRGFLLSGWSTLAKLSSAGVERIGFSRLEERVGQALGSLPGIRDVAARAPREGGRSVEAEAKAITVGFMKGIQDAKQVFKTGKSDLDLLYGKREVPVPKSIIDFFGNLHGSLKAITKRSEFERSFQKRMEYAIRNGEKVTDPEIEMKIGIEAYKDAQRSIFMQDNRVSSGWNALLKRLESADKTGATSKWAQLGAAGMRFMLPIVKVPTNIVAEAFQYSFGSITGSAGLVSALRKGAETLKPEEADLIMRQLKKGSLGLVGLATGFFMADSIGGFFQDGGPKRKNDDVKYGRIKIGTHQISPIFTDNPLLLTLQLGATVRRVMESKLKKSDQETRGLMAGIGAGVLGLAEATPFIRQIIDAHKIFDAKEQGSYGGELVKGAVVPQGVSQIAEAMDKNESGDVVKRDPKGIVQHIESGIPGLRKTLPLKRRQ